MYQKWECLDEMSSNTLKDQIGKVNIRSKSRGSTIEDKMRMACLNWFSHVERRSVDAILKIMMT